METKKSDGIFAGKGELSGTAIGFPTDQPIGWDVTEPIHPGGEDCCPDEEPQLDCGKSPNAPMQEYLGVKIIHAEPMDIVTFKSKKQEPYEGENASGYKVVYEDGYESWSPKHTFEKAYRPIDGLNFGLAIEALKMGKCVARKGWNVKGMFIWLNKGIFDGRTLGFKPGEEIYPNHDSTMDGVKFGLFENGPEGVVTRLPNINMRSASGSTVTGWLASQTDILAEDWMIVE